MIRRLAAVLAFTLLALSSAMVGPQQASATSGPRCPSDLAARTKPVGGPAPAGTVALIVTHGWTGGIDGNLKTLGDAVGRAIGTDKVAVRYFDYSRDSAQWASDPRIAACFAEFVHNVTDANHVKAVVAAHSMGGLAIRFATDPTYTAHEVTAKQLAEVVTIDTPHQGSPWGGTIPASAIQAVNFLLRHAFFPPVDALGAWCLQTHDRSKALPRNCPSPPYLPRGIDVTTIDGRINIERTLFGVKLYDIDHGGDGVVLSGSSTNYVQSVAGQKGPTGFTLRTATAQCSKTSDQTLNLISSTTPPYPTNLLKAWIKGVVGMWADTVTMDEIIAGRLGVASGAAWAADTLPGFSCNHKNVISTLTTLNTIKAAVRRHVPPPVFVMECSNPQATADHFKAIGNRSFPGYETWADAPNFAAVTDPLIKSMVTKCGKQFAEDAVSAANIVGRTWKAISARIDREALQIASDSAARQGAVLLKSPVAFALPGKKDITCGIKHLDEEYYHNRTSAFCIGNFVDGPVIPGHGPANMIMVTTKTEWKGIQYPAYYGGDSPGGWPRNSEGYGIIPRGVTVQYDDFRCTGIHGGVTCRNQTNGASFSVADGRGSLS